MQLDTRWCIVFLTSYTSDICMGFIGNTCFKGTPGVLKHYSGLPLASPGGPLNRNLLVLVDLEVTSATSEKAMHNDNARRTGNPFIFLQALKVENTCLIVLDYEALCSLR